MIPRAMAGWTAGLALAAAGLMALGLGTGSAALPPDGVLALLTGRAPLDAQAWDIITEFRLPRLLAGFGCGLLLALSGALLQHLTRNPLADPALVGVSQGAALAVVGLIALMPEGPFLLRQGVAFGGALLAAALLHFLTSGKGAGTAQGGSGRLILMGIGLSSLLTALIAVILTHGSLNDAQTALGWMSGSLNAVGWAEVRAVLASALVLAPLAVLAVGALSVLRLGDDMAVALGVRVGRARAAILILAVMMAAVATAAIGPVGYVGLIAPHLARRLIRAPLGWHLVLSGLVGANAVLLADLVARRLFDPLQLPTGLVTALIGAPVFLALLLRRTKFPPA